jgi:hypothetical protein
MRSLFQPVTGAIVALVMIFGLSGPATAVTISPQIQQMPCTTSGYFWFNALPGGVCYAYAGTTSIQRVVSGFTSGNNAGQFGYNGDGCTGCIHYFDKFQGQNYPGGITVTWLTIV